MPTRIERLHYQDRQYLRSFDYDAEQRYHLEMRRRLNLALHLSGIVYGLELVKPATLGEPWSISPGMAIDGFGREIVLAHSYPLGPDVLDEMGAQSTGGSYDVWIAYDRELTTPPEAGYRNCDLKDQYTRWREQPRFELSRSPSPAQAPGPAPHETLPDDPKKSPWLVPLGSIQVDPSLEITNSLTLGRIYVGLRAEHLIAPIETQMLPNPLPANLSALTFRMPIRVEADLLAQKHVMVGTNFPLTNATTKPLPPDTTVTKDGGSLKVAGDLYLRGGLFGQVNGDWLTFKEYLQSFIPDVQVGEASVNTAPGAGPGIEAAANGDVEVTVTTRLTSLSTPPVLRVALKEINYLSMANSALWNAAIGAADTNPVHIALSVLPGFTQAGLQYKFKVQWKVGPSAAVAALQRLHVKSLSFTWIAVFLP